MGQEGEKGSGKGEMGSEREGRSAGFVEEEVQRRGRGEVRDFMRWAKLRRIFARSGEWAPDLKERRAWREEVESDMMQGAGWNERASWVVLKRAKSSADCWLVRAKDGRRQEV